MCYFVTNAHKMFVKVIWPLYLIDILRLQLFSNFVLFSLFFFFRGSNLNNSTCCSKIWGWVLAQVCLTIFTCCSFLVVLLHPFRVFWCRCILSFPTLPLLRVGRLWFILIYFSSGCFCCLNTYIQAWSAMLQMEVIVDMFLITMTKKSM